LKTLRSEILIIFLVLALFLPLSEVFATSYRSTWYIYNLDDPQKRHLADIGVEYALPDKVEAGGQFEVEVSLTYVKNENAKSAWIEFFDVIVHTRTLPSGPNLTSSRLDSSRLRMIAGEKYSRTFSIEAPSEPSEYFVALNWKTFAPRIEAYGFVTDPREIGWDTWDTGRWSLPPRLVVQKPPPALELISRTLSPKEGEPIYSGETVTATYELKNRGKTILKAVKFTLETPTPKDVSLVEATLARDISPGAIEKFVVKIKFDKEGNYKVKILLYVGEVLVDEGILTVQVSPHPFSNLVLIGGVIALVLVILAAIVLVIRRRHVPRPETPTAPAYTPASPSRATPAAAKYCMSCGAPTSTAGRCLQRRLMSTPLAVLCVGE